MRKLNECKVLHVNLLDRSHYIEIFNEEDLKKYLGGRGIASLILYRDVPKGADPYGPENIIVFAPGLLAGTNISTAGRTTITGKSPATGLFAKSNMGGHWGAELKYAGYDMLVIHGISNKWVSLIITNNEVLFEPADSYFGLSVKETTERIKEEHKDKPSIAVSCIGQAGENLVKFAGIFCSVYSTAGRCGLGSVMGAKKLKAVSCFGRDGILVHDKKQFLKAAEHSRQMINSNDRCDFYRKYGTAGIIVQLNNSRTLPVRNFQNNHMDNIYNISGEYLLENGNMLRRESCFGCTISCKRYCKTIKTYSGIEAGGPEYETISAFGAGCEIADADVCIKANYLTNLYGLDSISTASAISWAIETAERGLIPKKFTDPNTNKEYNLGFGNGEAVLVLIEMIAFRRGLGNLLAEGTKIAAEKVGGDSWKWAMQAKGLEQSQCETRNAKAYALAFATNPRGPDHLYGQPMAEFGTSKAFRDIIQQITGNEKYAVPFSIKKKPEIVAWHEEVFALTDALGLCSRATLSAYAISPKDIREQFEAGTGIKISEENMFEAARRIINIERLFNIREGVGHEIDILPWRVMNEPNKSPDGKIAINSLEELNIMLNEYYKIRGWDRSGIPLYQTIKGLGLDKIIKGRCYRH